jgi:hypothetical protein
MVPARFWLVRCWRNPVLACQSPGLIGSGTTPIATDLALFG